MPDFPAALTALVDGVPGVGSPIYAKHINNLEAKVGVDGSAVATSLDYLLKSASSISPGHLHGPNDLTGDGRILISGSGEGSYYDCPALVVLEIPNDNPWHFVLINDLAGANRAALMYLDSTGGFNFAVGDGAGSYDLPMSIMPRDTVHATASPCIVGWYGTNWALDEYPGESLQNGIALSVGVAPTSIPTDVVQMWAEDVNGASGKMGLHMMSESGTGKLIVVGAVIKANTGDPSQVHEGLVCINTSDNTVKIYADGAWRTIASGW